MTHETETETCDNCGRDFRDPVYGPDLDEVLCPRCAGNKGPKSEEGFEDYLADLLEHDDDLDTEAETFEAAGVMTNNRGLVVRLPNGAEFQVTIVRSRSAR